MTKPRLVRKQHARSCLRISHEQLLRERFVRGRLLAFLAVVPVLFSVLVAPVPSASSQFFAPASASGDLFGYSVAWAGGSIVVGAAAGTDADGSVYVFDRGSRGWQVGAPLRARGFGSHIAASQSEVAIGAPGEGGRRGYVYVYLQNSLGWRLSARLSPGTGVPSFGESLALAGPLLVVGAPGTNGFATPYSAGAAYVYIRGGGQWHLQAVLRPPETEVGNFFGEAVSVSDGSIVVGAPGTASAKGAVGRAYVFAQSGQGWVGAATLYDPDNAPGDLFGQSVAMSGGALVVGAPGAADAAGRAYTYVRDADTSAWSSKNVLSGRGAEPGDSFGSSVAVAGSIFVVGMPLYDGGDGEVYVFSKRSSWTQEELTAPRTASGRFGFSMDLVGQSLLVGAPGLSTNVGRVYVYPNVN